MMSGNHPCRSLRCLATSYCVLPQNHCYDTEVDGNNASLLLLAIDGDAIQAGAVQSAQVPDALLDTSSPAAGWSIYKTERSSFNVVRPRRLREERAFEALLVGPCWSAGAGGGKMCIEPCEDDVDSLRPAPEKRPLAPPSSAQLVLETGSRTGGGQRAGQDGAAAHTVHHALFAVTAFHTGGGMMTFQGLYCETTVRNTRRVVASSALPTRRRIQSESFLFRKLH